MQPLLTNTYRGGLKTGYSLRESLTSQGVTCMNAMRRHLNRARDMVKDGSLDSIIKYRADTNYPNGDAFTIAA